MKCMVWISRIKSGYLFGVMSSGLSIWSVAMAKETAVQMVHVRQSFSLELLECLLSFVFYPLHRCVELKMASKESQHTQNQCECFQWFENGPNPDLFFTFSIGVFPIYWELKTCLGRLNKVPFPEGRDSLLHYPISPSMVWKCNTEGTVGGKIRAAQWQQ